MFREMRRKKQILSNKENIELLEKKLPKRNGSIIAYCCNPPYKKQNYCKLNFSLVSQYSHSL